MGLEQLSPSAQAEYNAMIPEIERATRASNQGRGMFYSGQATDAEVRAKADLLAKLAAQDTAVQATASENAKNRDAQQALQREEIKAGKRNSLVSLLGAGVGSAATLGGLAWMNRGGPGPGANIVENNGVKYFMDAKGNATPINFPGSNTSGTTAIGDRVSNLFSSDTVALNNGINMESEFPGMHPAVSGTSVGGGVAAAATAPPSMWQNLMNNKTPGGVAGRMGAAALGGGLGYLAGNSLTKNNGIGGEIGGGLGGLGGLALASKFSANPWAAGLGALLGAGGGSWLGNALGRSL